MTDQGSFFDPEPETDHRGGPPPSAQMPRWLTRRSPEERLEGLAWLTRTKADLERVVRQPKRLKRGCQWLLTAEPCDGPIQLHHFWPRAIFGPEVAEAGPTAWYCEKHHRFWHDTMQAYYGQMYLTLAERLSPSSGAAASPRPPSPAPPR